MDEAIAEELSRDFDAQIILDAEQPIAEETMEMPKEEDITEMFKSMKKKKKKPAKKASEGAEDGEANEEASEAISAVEKDNDARYGSLLSRIFTILRLQNPDMAGERKKYSMIPPNVQREGTKKTMFANLSEISKRMNRPMEHVIQYLYAELGTTGSTDANERLIIKGRFQQRQIENVLKHYIMEYVTCKTCKSGNTNLRKENRLSFMVCESCGSTRSVSAIKTGFKAQTEKRRAQRAKEG